MDREKVCYCFCCEHVGDSIVSVINMYEAKLMFFKETCKGCILKMLFFKKHVRYVSCTCYF